MELNRQFQFYDIIPIKDPQYGSVDDSLFSNPSLSSICATPSYLIFNSNTTIKILSQQYELITEFKSYDLSYNVIKVIHIKQTSLIATILEKLGSPNSLKIWDLNRVMKSGNKIDEHSYHSQVEISNGDNNYPITCFDSNVDFNLLVFGYSNGNVILIRGDIIRDKGSRQRLIYQDIDPITGLFLKDDLVFITTISKILTMPTNGKTQPLLFLDKKTGSELGNCTFNYKSQELIVGNDKNLVFYNNSQKLSTLVLSYLKKRIYNLSEKNYLLVVSPTTSTTTRLLILDYEERQIILNNTVSSTIKEVFEWNNDLYLLTNDGLLLKLTEKPLPQQLEIIIQRDLYPIAIKLLRKNKLATKEIHLKYAEYLYNRSEFDDSMDQYIKCLDKDSETSDVIKRFKNNQNLPNLIKYLYLMFKKSLHNEDHLTLLMCCYIKLKLKLELSSLIDELSADEKFDLDTVIQLCRDSLFHDIATKLAKLYNEYQLIIDIQLNDLDQYDEALDYCKTLSINDVLTILLSPTLSFVKKLLDKKPDKMTNLLIEIFTGKFYQNNNGESSNTYLPPKPRLIFKSFINNEKEFVFFLESCIESYEKFRGDESDKKDLIITLFEIYISLYSKTSDEEWSSKLKSLIKKHEQIVDLDQVLILCQLNDFQLDDEMYDDKNIIDFYRSCVISKDLTKAVEILHKYGSQEHVLFNLALKFYCSSEEVYNLVSKEEFEFLLSSIQKYKTLTVLEIVEIMSLNEVPKIGVAKGLLLNYITSVKKNLSKNEKLIESYESENAQLAEDIRKLSTSPSTVQVSKCLACKQQLRMPIIHFKCSHSYHLNCINDIEVSNESEYQCPRCVNEMEEIVSIRKQQEELSDRNDLFLNVINNELNEDNLQVISDFIGRGSLENLRYIVE